MDDSDLALERAVQQLDCESESSDIEVDPQEREVEGSSTMDGPPSALTREMLERMYPKPSVPSKQMVVEHGERLSEGGSLLSTSSASHQSGTPRIGAEVSLRSIFDNEKSFIQFRTFLMDQCITRNLNFWLACEHFQAMGTGASNLREVANAIYAKFVKLSAPQHVTITKDTKIHIKMALSSNKRPVLPSLYSIAQREIFDRMSKNELGQFLVADGLSSCAGYPDMVSLDYYTPSMANPSYGLCGGGSLLNSGSEDSTSISSFCTDDAGPRSSTGPRSAVYCRPSRPLANRGSRGAISDSENSRPRKSRQNGACIKMGVHIPYEEFAFQLRERLLAVNKDRDTMTQKARDIARQQAKPYEDIMNSQWYNLPEVRKYLVTQEASDGEILPQDIADGNISEDEVVNRPSTPRTMSPSELSTLCNSGNENSRVSELSTLCNSGMGNSQTSLLSGKPGHDHINSLAMKEVEDALRDLKVTNQVTKKRSSRSESSSVLSTTSDSGLGDTWTRTTSGLTTPSTDHRIRAYLRGQNILSTNLQPRERDAQAAAIALISNSPQPESLNPSLPIQQHHHHQQQIQRPLLQPVGPHDMERQHPQARQPPFGPAYSSGDDSSSVFTMTSQSSTSDLFIPRKPHQHTVYTDPEDQNHLGSNRYRRMLTTPKRSNHMKHGHGPSPLAEQHRQLSLPHPALPPPPQQDANSGTELALHQQHSMSLMKSGVGVVGGGGGGGTVHLIYNLDDIPTPYYAKMNNGVGTTLGVFKERVFARKGEYRFFFESYNAEMGMSLLEEYIEDDSCLPVVGGKIIGRVERA